MTSSSPAPATTALLVGLLSSFLRDQPSLRLELALNERRVDVIAEGFDLAVRVGAPQDSGLIAIALTVFPYVFCAAPDYLRARGAPQRPQDLLAHGCIVNTALTVEGQWRFVRDGCAVAVAPPARARVNSDAPAVRFVRDGLGIELCMRLPLEPALAAGALVAVLADWNAYRRQVHALVPHRPLMPAKIVSRGVV